MSTDADASRIATGTTPADVLGRVDEAVYAVDTDWQITFVNTQAAAVMDDDPDELLGRTVWEVLPEADESAARDRFTEAMEGQEPTRFETYNKERETWFSVRAYPATDGLTVCFYDVTDERAQQLELQRKRRLFETVFEDTEDALIIADPERQITEFNPAAERLFGYDESDVVGEKARILYADEADYDQQGEKRFNADAPEQHESYRVTYERADGTTFEGETVGTPLNGPDGETLAFLGAVRDVSDRVAYEREIEARNDVLRQFHDITTDEQRSFEATVSNMLELGASYFDLDSGILSRIDGREYTVETAVGPDDAVEAGDTFDLEETVCERVVDSERAIGFHTPEAGEVTNHPADATQDLESYLGAPVVVDGERYGTLDFFSPTTRGRPIAESERTFVRILAQWVGKELSRRQSRERARANRDRLRQIIDMLPQLIFAKDENGEFLLANEALADAYGTTVTDLEGATDADFADSEAEAEQFREDDRGVIEAGEPKHIPEEPLTTADGERRVFETTKIPYDPVETDGDAVLGVATDITDRKERERELHLQSAAMEASMDGIAILDDDEYVYMNEAHADVFDFDPAELLGSSWRRLYGDEEVQRLESEVFPELQERGEWRGVTVGQKRDGTSVHQEITLSLLDDGQLICTNRDITERQQREQELERQRTRLRALFDESPDGIVIHDASGNVLDVNETETESLGYDREELLSMNVAEFEAGFDQPELEAVWADMDDGDLLKVEGAHQRRDGSTFPVEVWVNKVKVHGRERFIALDRDITERKQREQELETKTTQLEAILENTTAPMFMKDADGEYVLANREYREVFGFEAGDVVGKTDMELHPEGMTQQVRNNDAAVLDRGESVEVEEHIQTDDGERIYLTTKSPIYGLDETTADDIPDAVFGVASDITERTEREWELERTKEFIQKTQESASIGGWEVDLETEALRWTDEVYRIHDLPLDANVTLEDGLDFYHPDDRATIGAAFEHLRTEGESYDLELRIVTAADETRWVRAIGDPLFDDDGTVVGARGIFQDITERRQNEQDLRELTERLDLAVEGANLGVWDWDMETDAVTFNEQWAAMLGFSLEDIEPTLDTWEQRVHPEDMPRVERQLHAHLEGETELYDCEHRMQTSGGDWKWIRDVGEVVERDEDGTPLRAVGIHIDVTERRETQRALEAERDMFAQGPAIVFKWENADGWPVDYVSDNVAETLGYTPAQLESGEVPYVDLIHDDDIDRVTAEVEANSDGTTERFSHDPYRMVTSDGEIRWVRDNTKVVREDGEVTHYLGYLVDITERKRRERELQTIRQRFERFASAVPNGFFLISPDYEETRYVNDATERLYGVSLDEVKQDPSLWMEHIHPEDVDRLRADMRAQQNGTADWPITQEFRVQHPERGLRWIQARIHPIEDDERDLVELAGVAADITERKQLEQSLRTSEQSLRELTAIAADTDRDFERKLRDVLELGRERLDLPYGYLTRIEDDQQRVVAATGSHPWLREGNSVPLSRTYCQQTIEQTGIFTVQNALESGWDDDPAYETLELGCYLGATVEVDGEQYGTLCFAGDDGREPSFDDADRAFVELLVQWIDYELTSNAIETKLRDLNATAQDLMATADPDELASITTRSANSVLGLPMTGIWWHDEPTDTLVPADMTDAAAGVVDTQPTFEGGESLAWKAFETGETLVYDDLQSATARYNADTPMQSELIVPVGDHGVLVSGSTQQRAFSETDRSLTEVLSATVEAALNRAEREQELRETRHRLEQSNEELEQFAYAASHDLQEPLRTVSSYLTLLERRYGDDLDADAEEFIGLAVDGADRMREMIQALLAYSRVDTRGTALDPVDITGVFDRVRQNLDVTIEETDATVDLPDTTATVVGDETQLVQLFQNLVENGIKYSEGDPTVEISVERRDDQLAIAVNDDGIGIDPDQLDEIFEVFQRLHTREEFEGTGIGLSLCRKIVDRHDGEIRVDSTPGEGSTFTVALPVAGDQCE